MQNSPFRSSVSLLLLVGLGSFGCGQTADSRAPTDGASQGGDGAMPALPNSVEEVPVGSARTAPATTANAADPAAPELPADSAAGGAPTDDALPAPNHDRTPPRIVSVDPADGATGVQSTARIVIQF